MKKKKEIWVEVCDFCGEKKVNVCGLCGKDLCRLHTLHLERSYTNEELSPSSICFGGKTVMSCFCPDHLGLELTEKYNQSIRGLQGSAKT